MNRIVKGIPDLCVWFQKVHEVSMSRPTIMKYIEEGMPCCFLFNAYHFHTANIDAWFRAKTLRAVKDPPEEKIIGGD